MWIKPKNFRAVLVVLCAGLLASGVVLGDCGPMGSQRIAVILVDLPSSFPDTGATTPEDIRTVLLGSGNGTLDGSLRALIAEESRGKATIDRVDVFGRYRLSSDPLCSGTNIDRLRDNAIEAASADTDLTQYNRIFILTNKSACDNTSWGTLGCNVISVKKDGKKAKILASVLWQPAVLSSKTSFIGSGSHHDILSAARAYTHEFGHNLGLPHSLAMLFGSDAVGAPGEKGRVQENLRDAFSPMGNGTSSYYTSHDLAQLGWLDSSEIIEARTSGEYTLLPLSAPEAGPRVLKVFRGDSALWIEYRQPVGDFEKNTLTTRGIAMPNGAILHTDDGLALDFSPGLPISRANANPTAEGYGDVTLFPSQLDPVLRGSWKDPYSSLRLEVVQATPRGLTIRVQTEGR